MITRLEKLSVFFQAVISIAEEIANTTSSISSQYGPWVGLLFFIGLIFVINKLRK